MSNQLVPKWEIYLIYNHINRKTYIGQHIYKENNSDRTEYFGSGTLIKRAINKYKKENFSKIILIDELNSQDEANFYEKTYIKIYKNFNAAEYNIKPGGQKFTTEEIKQNMSKGYKYHLTSTTWKKGHIPWNKGKAQSEETKKKLAESLKGNKCRLTYKNIKCVETGEVFPTINDIFVKYPKAGKIWAVLKGHRKIAAGLHWICLG